MFIIGYDDSIQSMTVVPIIPQSCFDATLNHHSYTLASSLSSRLHSFTSSFLLLPIFFKFNMIQPPFDQFATLTAPTTTSSVAPIPTVIPGSEVYQELHDVGKRTLWYEYIIDIY